MKPESFGQSVVAVVDGSFTYGAPEALSGDAELILSGLSLVGARRIFAALQRLIGEPRKPRPKAVPVFVRVTGRVIRFPSISVASRVLGIDRTKLWRDLVDGGDCPVCGGFTDDSDLAGIAGSDYTAWRGCACAKSYN